MSLVYCSIKCSCMLPFRRWDTFLLELVDGSAWSKFKMCNRFKPPLFPSVNRRHDSSIHRFFFFSFSLVKFLSAFGIEFSPKIKEEEKLSNKHIFLFMKNSWETIKCFLSFLLRFLSRLFSHSKLPSPGASSTSSSTWKRRSWGGRKFFLSSKDQQKRLARITGNVIQFPCERSRTEKSLNSCEISSVKLHSRCYPLNQFTHVALRPFSCLEMKLNWSHHLPGFFVISKLAILFLRSLTEIYVRDKFEI